ncbi:MAG TPA: short chain dehydrogenase [Noviherbaspirillum sp.]|jgi:NAD(P)-dependent dehydrogenase (short-subunit alcohol dehydrogenase family)|uniref:short chain dehydrogenase n=1 Tax=Noviherbaspirillum sp. TaxID=1926288 RepID=UPI002F932404
MKVIVIGAAGTVGSAVAEALGERHEVIRAGRSGGDYRVDMADIASVQRLFDQAGRVDAVVAAAGEVHFGPFADMTPAQFDIGLRQKLMGQVNVALVARDRLADGGSITLTSGILTQEPIRYGVSATTVNAAVEGFARAAAIELPRALRINVVNASVLTESLPVYADYFRGFEPVPARRVAQAYVKSVDGLQTGRVYEVR